MLWHVVFFYVLFPFPSGVLNEELHLPVTEVQAKVQSAVVLQGCLQFHASHLLQQTVSV